MCASISVIACGGSTACARSSSIMVELRAKGMYAARVTMKNSVGNSANTK